MLKKCTLLFLLLGLALDVYAKALPARLKRQIDLTLSAEHDDKVDETEVILEAIANLWRSTDGNTQIEGSAKVVHKSNSFQDGNNHYQARLHVHHDYAKQNHINPNKCVAVLC